VPRKPRYGCRALSLEDASQLRQTAQLYGGREGLSVLLGLYLAARRAEIATMRWGGYGEGRMRFQRAKSFEVADLPVHPVLGEAMDAYGQRASSDYLFPGDRGRPHVGPSTVWEWIRHVGQVAGVTVTPHVLRHTALATMNDSTGDLRATQEVAGHRDPQTTAIYTRATQARVRAAIDALEF
jgi:integrase/recombinase XerD